MRTKEQKSEPLKAKAVAFLLTAFGSIPPRLSFTFAKILALLLWPIPSKTKLVIRRNLDHCLPDLPKAKRNKLARASFENTIISFFEIAYFWVGKVDKYAKITISVPEKSLLDEAVAEDRGVLLACPHLGHWELVNYFLASHYELLALYRPPKIAELDDFMTRSRERFGGQLIPASAKGIKTLYRELHHQKVLAILPDQEPGATGGVFAPFFGVEAWSMTLVNRLLKKTNAHLLYCFAERKSYSHYEIHLLPGDNKNYDPDINKAVTALNAGVEKCILRCPEQYQWSYKRFKSRPDKAPHFYH